MTAATSTESALTVGQVADRFGVTVRTLHHYDEIGLLSPSRRTHAGYRLYDASDLARLQQVVVYRRLGFSLEEVTALLSDADAVAHLRRQRAAVMTRIGELHALVDALDHALEQQMNDTPLTEADLKDLFGESFSDEHQAEAETRWGQTPQWRQSSARTARYTREDWLAIKAEGEAVYAALLRVFRTGAAPDSEPAVAAAEAHRRHIDRRYYDCPAAFHVNLGDLYVADPRYLASVGGDGLDGVGESVRDAFVANAVRRRSTAEGS